MYAIVKLRSLRLFASALVAGAALAGCGGAASTTTGTHSHTAVGAGTSHSETQSSGQHQSAARSLTFEEMREYDANEGRCEDDGGHIRDVGTLNAYCAFSARANDFHLVETSHEKEPAGEEE